MLQLTVIMEWIVLRRCGPCCVISEEGVAAAIKGLKIGKAAGPAGVESKTMMASDGFGTRWMINLITQYTYIH